MDCELKWPIAWYRLSSDLGDGGDGARVDLFHKWSCALLRSASDLDIIVENGRHFFILLCPSQSITRFLMIYTFLWCFDTYSEPSLCFYFVCILRAGEKKESHKLLLQLLSHFHSFHHRRNHIHPLVLMWHVPKAFSQPAKEFIMTIFSGFLILLCPQIYICI